jgi:hypothetical protein
MGLVYAYLKHTVMMSDLLGERAVKDVQQTGHLEVLSIAGTLSLESFDVSKVPYVL